MSVSRAKFLKSLGSSVTSMALGTALASAADALTNAAPAAPAPPPVVKPAAPAPIHFYESGPATDNRITLTFDDGPTPGVTDHILDELKQRNLLATFFMIGERVAAYPELVKRVSAEGHEIGNHSYSHPKLSLMSDTQVQSQLQKTQDAIGSLVMTKPVWFRPPYGAFRKSQASIAQSLGLNVAIWSIDPRDWSQPGEEKIVSTILAEAKAGSIILCHDLHKQTGNCVSNLLDSLVAKQFNFVTVSTLLGSPSAVS